MRRRAFVVSGLVGGALVACIGVEVADEGAPATTDAGTVADAEGAGDAGGGSALPLLDDYSVSVEARSGTQDVCIQTIDAAMRALGGGYATAASAPSSFARYGDRSGSTAIASCVDAAGMVVTEVWTAHGAGSASTDDTRLFALATGRPAGGLTTSQAAGDVGKIDARQRLLTGGPTAAAACVADAKRAISGLLPRASGGSPTWNREGPLLAVGGFAGTSFSITCLNDTGVRVLDVLTVDKGTSPDARIDALQAALEAR